MKVIQENNVHIIDNRGAPPELVRLAQEAGSKCPTIDVVVFDAFIDKLNGNLGCFDPVIKTVIVDMGACVTNTEWMKKGILYIPNVWFNLVFSLFHEVAHAFQLEEEPTLIEFNELPEEFEEEANKIAEDSLIEWAKEGTIPRLSELNWAGDRIKSTLNKLYAQSPQTVLEELTVEGTKAAANALHASLSTDRYADEQERGQLLKSIDDGDIGTIVEGKKYLTAYEAINTTQEGHYEGH